MSAVQETSAQPAWNRLQWSALDEAARTRALTRPVQVVADATRQAVAAVLDAVRSRGDEALRELTARLHSLQRRASGRCVNPVEHGPLRYDPSTREVVLDGLPVELTRREHALLEALLHNPGRILSGEQLKNALYGFTDDVESNALNVHIHHLRRKLGNRIIETVRGLGYRLGEPGWPAS